MINEQPQQPTAPPQPPSQHPQTPPPSQQESKDTAPRTTNGSSPGSPGAPGEFKPNIYPVIYWAIAYGVIAGSILFLVNILSRYITLIWFPVFLAGLIWGGFRNYQKQKRQWTQSSGATPQPQTPVEEFKEAIRDIADASQEMIAEQREEDSQRASEQQSPSEDESQQDQPPA